MKKTYRVKKETDFQKVIEYRQTVANRNLVLFVKPKEGQAHFRVGLSVGKRIGNAVMRNRVKRKLREGMHQLKPLLPNEYDFVLIARPNIVTLSTAEVEKNLRHIFRLANIMK